MYLKEYFPNIEKKYQNYFFSNISFDSSKIKKNFIFFAIKGNNHDGNKFIKEAIRKGAKIIVHQKKIYIHRFCSMVTFAPFGCYIFSKND